MELYSSLTSLSYIVIGFFVLRKGYPFISYCLLVLGIGSFSFHFFGVPFAQILDRIGMIFMFTSLLLFLLGRKGWRGLSLVIGTLLIILTLFIPSFLVIAILFFLVIVAKMLEHGLDSGLYIMFVFSTAYTAWIINEDLSHSMWHIITAYGIYEVIFHGRKTSLYR